MGKITITKKFEFCYGHFLPAYEGKCANFHGHNSTLEVEVDDHNKVNNYDGMVMDFGDLKKIVKEKIVDVLDHKNLNDLPMFASVAPTAENIVQWVVRELTHEDSPLRFCLVRVRVYETPDSYAEWNA